MSFTLWRRTTVSFTLLASHFFLQTFRTAEEGVELANNTRYGLSAGVWTENMSLALETAMSVKAGVVWINSHNQFDAAAGFGGYKESGFGREGGKEGLFMYTKPAWQASSSSSSSSSSKKRGANHTDHQWDLFSGGAGAWGKPDASLALPPAPAEDGTVTSLSPSSSSSSSLPSIDRTPKMYIGGSQKRPDGNYTSPVYGASRGNGGNGGNGGNAPVALGLVGDGNRKDIRDAVEAAHKAAPGWGKRAAHDRAQIMFYIAENLSARRGEFGDRISSMSGEGGEAGLKEVDASISRLFTYAAWADKYVGCCVCVCVCVCVCCGGGCASSEHVSVHGSVSV